MNDESKSRSNELPSSDPDKNPGGQRALTRSEYDRLTPRQQGFVTYMQGAWNPAVPNFNQYRPGSKQHREFTEGEQHAVIVAQDSETE